jgi:hypothetical protein
LLLDKFRDLVLNDKEKQNYNNFKYFIPFLNNAETEYAKAEIFTHMEFMMKRNGSLIDLISRTIKELKKV